MKKTYRAKAENDLKMFINQTIKSMNRFGKRLGMLVSYDKFMTVFSGFENLKLI